MTSSTRAAAAAALIFLSACDRPREERHANGAPRIELNFSRSAAVTIDVTGLPAADLSRLEQRVVTPDDWTSLLRIAVAGDPATATDRPAVLGAYTIDDGVLRFTPQFPFDPGQRYDVTFDPSRLPVPDVEPHASWRTRRIETSITIPAPERHATTRVVEIFPTGREVPENLLRLYISFSAPMSLARGSKHIRLIDQSGREVEDPFLPLDVDLWNEDRTRYTLLFDPGRVKRGIVPNEEMGRSLIEGRKYTLLIDADWPDANGQPLAAPFRRELSVGAPQERGLDPSTWQLNRPPANTTDPLVVSFPRPLDYGLLFRALSVSDAEGRRIAGEIRVESEETRWIFVPRAPWQPGEHGLIASSVLEDAAGNRIGRPFEAEIVPRGRAGAEARTAMLPFRIKSVKEKS